MCALFLEISHRPDGKMANVLAFDSRLHNCGWSTTVCTCRKDLEKFPSPRWEKWLTCLPRLSLAQLRPTLRSTTDGTCHRDLEFSHRSDGRLTFCSLFVQGGGVSVESGTVSIVNSQVYSNQATNVRARLQKFPLPPWETHVLLVACRAAVSLSRVAL